MSAWKLLQSSVWQQESVRPSDEVLSCDLEFDTPDSEGNQALAWTSVALDQAWVCNDDLMNCAYVTGDGPSRQKFVSRQQHAWFFAGDGMIALYALLAWVNSTGYETKFVLSPSIRICGPG